ncbi:MAG: tail fiber domain-containing protein [Bacteroidales bacterium]|nr:tail fiber domain-containing protein [Bacteroidales bacterium]
MNKNIITKSIFSTAIIAAIATGATAQQLPSTFNYQAVVNADDGSPVAAKKITVEVSILQGNDCENNPGACPVLWQELHYPTTSDFGLFSIEIGAPSATNTYAGSQANYSTIDWLNVSQGYYYLKVRADFGESENLNSLSDLGTTKFSAVPYSLVAQKADFATSATSANTITPDANDKIKNKLAQLADVDVTTVSAGEVLAWDGTKWTNKVPAAQGVSTLKDLTDTDYGTPANKDVLMYNSTAGKWESKALDLKQSLSDLTDVTTATPENGQVLTYNEGGWKNQAITLSTLSGVNITSPAANQILTYDGSKWINKAPAQWTANTTGIHYNEGNVGIGSDNPDQLLVIKQDDNKITRFDGDGIAMKSGYITLSGAVAQQGSVAIGSSTDAHGTASFAMGTNTKTTKNYSMAIGKDLTNNVPNSLVVGAGRTNGDYLFLVANIDKDAFTVNHEGICTYATSMTGSSDRRLKTNITSLEKSLDKVMKLNGVTFNWDKTVRPSAPTTLQYGFIAQEIEKVIPELVSEDSDGYKTVNYIGVIPVLTQAMQEQQKEIEQLKDENKKLNETIEALLKRVEALEKK